MRAAGVPVHPRAQISQHHCRQPRIQIIAPMAHAAVAMAMPRNTTANNAERMKVARTMARSI